MSNEQKDEVEGHPRIRFDKSDVERHRGEGEPDSGESEEAAEEPDEGQGKDEVEGHPRIRFGSEDAPDRT